ncbi:MAG: ABC-F family ATP-binding cassette domain-containing protein [Bacteroidia bacterium]|nr:ABC-F family ATP-binding cassette domain-containing protein [Bacteroidia bacterium]
MNLLSVDRLTKSFGDKILFENLSFGLNKGDKTAIIAGNGSGKTTLLNIISSKDSSDSGNVTIRQGIKIGFLEQNPILATELSVAEMIKQSGLEVHKIINEYEKLLEAPESENKQKALSDATAKMDHYDAWNFETRINQILSRFEITDTSQKISLLSGGQVKRVAMALVLINAPDVLILDEPTNHLDIEMIEWLERFLVQSNTTLLMVTHDRYFLDRVCNHIIELNDGKLYHHKGNYSYFLEKRMEREEVFQKDISKAGKLMKKELEWMRRSPKARTTKSKSRISSFYETEAKAKSGKVRDELELNVKMTRIGGKILEMKKVRMKYDDLTILDGFDYTFKKKERVGIVGKNGTGKSTFLKLVTNEIEPDSGKINIGDTIVYGYYTQSGIKLKDNQRVIDVLREIADVIILNDKTKLSASQLLQQFMFPVSMHRNMVSKLSGGEKRRLYLLTILMKNPNFLILDEPTNDLDLLTLNKLEDFLLSFAGCLIVVSHDRYFLDKLCDHLFIFEGNGKIKDYNGSYSEFRYHQKLEEKKAKEKEAALKSADNKKQKESKEKTKLSFNEKREYEQIEKDIELLEKEKEELELVLNNPDAEFEKIQTASTRLGEVMELIDTKSNRWLELSQFI